MRSEMVQPGDYMAHDYSNLYRTSYNDMRSKVNWQKFYLFRFPISKTVISFPITKALYPACVPKTRSAKTFPVWLQIALRLLGTQTRKWTSKSKIWLTFRSWQYNPLSKTHGSFTKREYNNMPQSFREHAVTSKLRDSGYTANNMAKEKTGWVTDPCLHSDLVRTEYRIQYNPKKEIHYKGSLYNTGVLKKKEFVYKHM